MITSVQRPFELVTDDGVRLDAWRWEGADERRAAAVLVHGFVGRGCSPGAMAIVEALAADGLTVVSYDARGHGASGGTCTLGALERHDVGAAVAAAREHADQVLVIGESAGGIAALLHAADGDVDGVVTVGSPALWRMSPNARTLAAALLTRTPLGRRLARRALNVRIERGWLHDHPPAAVAARVQVPYAVVHGLDDPFIAPREAAALHAAAGGPSRLDLVEGMGHGFSTVSVAPIRSAVSWALSVRAPAGCSN